MDLQQAILVSEKNGPSPKNDRHWASHHISKRAKAGLRSWVTGDLESMPGGGNVERLQALLIVLEGEGFVVKKLVDLFERSYEVSW
jgi:hypothetical protein